MVLTGDVLDRIEALYDQGRFLSAYQLGERVAPLDRWEGTRGRILASRLAHQLGNPRRSHALATLAWRRDPANLQARCLYAHGRLARAGPWPTLRFLLRHPAPGDGNARDRCGWFGLHAYTLAFLRDFERAREWIERAAELAPDDPWLWVQRSAVLALEDRHAEALDAARTALDRETGSVNAVLAVADSLRRLGRAGDALSILRDAAGRLESYWLTQTLAWLLMELQAWPEADRVATRLASLAPLLPPEGTRALNGLRSEIAYRLGDRDAAIQLARAAGPGFHQAVAERMAAFAGAPRRVRLAVPFVQQHHMTCGPATLTALGRYWGLAVDHDELAREISYEGTPDHVERHWAETHGCVVREFRVTWESAVSLLDRGVPFSLITVQPTAAHLQAVIGYDELRGTLLIQDPTTGLTEALASGLLEDQRSSGPRGMALVPEAEASRLTGLELPDAEIHDTVHRLKRALAGHDRDAAARECAALAGTHATHRLAISARWQLAIYDGDQHAGLACVEELLGLYPESQWLEASKHTYLVDLERRGERLRLVDEICGRAGFHPLWWHRAAEERLADAREWPLAERLARRALRHMPDEARVYYTLGVLRGEQRHVDEALELYRVAACLQPTNELLSDAYAARAQGWGRFDEALRFLRGRVARYGQQSSAPARTLYAALARAHRLTEAFGVLDEALAARPDDPDLLLFAAREHASDGHHDRAEALLGRAQLGPCHQGGGVGGMASRPLAARPTAWARAAADAALARGDAGRALELLRGIVSAEPFDVEAHRDLALVLERQLGREAAREHLKRIAARLPHHLRIQQLHLEWLRDGDPAEAEAVLRQLIDTHPTFSWAHGELIWRLAHEGRVEEAAALAETALSLEPHFSYNHALRGLVYAAAGARGLARERFRQAVRLDVDNGFAILELVRAGDTHAERTEALAFVRGELERQTVLGPGLASFREAARSVHAAADVLALCREALAARPDLLAAWTETIRQLLDMHHADEAASMAAQATERFPVMAEVHALLAQAHLLRGDRERQIAALARARALAPAEASHVLAHGVAMQDAGRSEEARDVLAVAVTRFPRDATVRVALAGVHWARGDREAALEAMEAALRLSPESLWAWSELRRWSEAIGDPPRPERLAHQLTQERPGDASVWIALANALTGRETVQARLDALERAIAANPRQIEAHDLRAATLADLDRFDEALEACRPAVFGPSIPQPLRGRAAWIEARRGHRPLAITRMRELLDRGPDYFWGWRNLAEWCEAEGSVDAALEAAGWVTRLGPGSAESWAQRGRIELGAGRRDDARQTLRRALDLDPSHPSAGFTLVDLSLDDGDLDAAAAALAGLSVHGDEHVLPRRARIASQQGEREAAILLFQQICAMRTESPWPVQGAAQALIAAGWHEDADRILTRAVSEPDAGAGALVAWAARCAETMTMSSNIRPLAALVRRGGVGARAASAFVEKLAERRAYALARRLRKATGDLFRQETEIWGSYGYAAVASGESAEAIEWLSDWRERPGARPWMLIYLTMALRDEHRWTEAAEVSRHALGLSPDEASSGHLCWLALDDVLAGRTAQAQERLAGVHAGALMPYFHGLLEILHVCLAAEASDGAARSESARRAHAHLRDLTERHRLRAAPTALRRARDRCEARILRLRGGPASRLRAWWLGR